MSKHKDRLAGIVKTLSADQMESALQFLIGYDITTAAVTIQWVLNTYPEGRHKLTDKDL